MRLLYVIDPLDTLNLETETSLLMMEEAARRGHQNAITTIGDLYLDGARACARARAITLNLAERPFYRLADLGDSPLEDFDLVLMRKDPPVDAAYLAATFVLERATASVPVINEPSSLRLVNEKLLPLAFAPFTPPSIFTNERARMREFVARHGRSILKPLADCSGRGIVILPDPEAVPPDLGGQFVLVQQYIDAVIEGDKRIFVLAGRPLGAVNRIPRGPLQLANIHQGAIVAPTSITRRDQEIIDAIAPTLISRGLWMAGIDVIGGYLTEINVTSPSAVRQINAVSGSNIERELVDFLESKARRR
ncbi:MAG: glutathione synthase [Deltaproteobacteria bacterium]|nr:glutathione synthase [Deltaproteobacteria bacterium]